MKCKNAQDHVGLAETNDRTIKESIGVQHHRCGCNTIPKQMMMASAEHSTEKLNVFPAKNGTLDCHRPEMIVTGNTMHCNEHCQHEIGKCAQAHHKP